MKYMQHLKRDKKLARIVKVPLSPLKIKKNVPLRLMASIMSQQLNTKVAQIIYKRFITLFGGKEPSAIQVLNTSSEALRNIGLSNSKVSYVKNVATFCLEQKVTDRKLLQLENEEVIELLTKIKGVGSWTVEMLLMFSLGREDVFAVDDLGIQNAMVKLYNLDSADKKNLKQTMNSLAQKWSPFRTYACIYLWQFKDGG